MHVYYLELVARNFESKRLHNMTDGKVSFVSFVSYFIKRQQCLTLAWFTTKTLYQCLINIHSRVEKGESQQDLQCLAAILTQSSRVFSLQMFIHCCRTRVVCHMNFA